jgi:hypothetical protein
LPFWTGFQPADTKYLKTQALLSASDDAPLACSFARTIAAPHLLKVAELANLGTEDVDDDVVGVDEHPVAVGQAFDARRRQARFLALFNHAIGDGSDVNVGAAAGNDHHVGESGFAVQVDGDDVFSF